jgi:steroid 5-alpha reductase family enzyme
MIRGWRFLGVSASRQYFTTLLVIGATVAIAALCAQLAAPGSLLCFGLPVPAVVAVLCFAVNWLAFLPAMLLRSERFYDLVGSLTYLLVAALCTFVAIERGEPLRLLLCGVVVIWAVRLGSFLVRRIKRTGRDGRFDQIKHNPPRFFVAWTLQGLWVFLTSLAVVILSSSRTPLVMGFAVPLGLGSWLAGFWLQTVADAQKARFAKDPAERGRFIQSGLWAWSRHPNYFGEITLWSGLFLVGLHSYRGGQWVAVVSPLFVTLLLTRVSGIPLLERRADRRWGGDASYEEYKRRTPLLIPRPPRISDRS